MFTIARNELYRLFLSPLAWLILALGQVILAYLFLTHIDRFMQLQASISAIPGAPGVTELIAAPLFSNVAVILLLLSPAITMRLIAEERRNDSLPLLRSAPISIIDIVLGKYLGTLVFMIVFLVMASLMPLSLSFGSDLDYWLIASCLLGLLLLVTSFCAIGLFLSSLTKQPTIAAISTFSLLFLLWIIDWSGNASTTATSFNMLSWLSLLSHFEPLLQGNVNTSDIAYYLILNIVFLSFTVRHLNSERFS
jgi:ABC-2 type transport system permease protein